ncbi:lipase [Corynebacterium diphtheriae]|nr:lipase [Corynebacterium diphtheriae]CAB0810975.1 lipase [Corynebacterium diphtheriae]CAB0960914.1 lipase [Corynebacterium diphtheriae]CAB0969182.1 lipase [Corynebacterium diphtheriae]CAB1044530.1 lipase [Corynebacterium diphtheriae]
MMRKHFLSRSSLRAIVLCVSLGTLSAQAVSVPNAIAQSSLPASPLDSFYSSIPSGENTVAGTVLSEQVIPTGLLDATIKVKRIAYSSTHPSGRMVPTTATILTPTAPWTGSGPRPAALLAPGTQGAGDQCAPSKLITVGAEYELFPAIMLLRRGWTVAITDYQGLGTIGAHTYMNRKAQGAALLDLGRAVVNVKYPEVRKDAPLILWGYSQGGGASAAAAEMHASYAPDVNIRGGFAGGVPAELLSTARSLEGSPLLGALGYAISGMYETHPELRPEVDDLLNDRGKQWIFDSGTHCLVDSFRTMPIPDSRVMTRSGQRLTDLLGSKVFHSYFEEQRLGKVAPDVPMFVSQGANDDIIPAQQARDMVSNWRDLGADVTYFEDPAPLLVRMEGHVRPLVTSFGPALQWAERLLGSEVINPPSAS